MTFREQGGGRKMMRKVVLLLACVQKCASEDPPYTGKCAHDPSAKALTHELLEQGYNAYKDIECVPAWLFCQRFGNSNCDTGTAYGSKDVVIAGELNFLLHVEFRAFHSFAGKITWSADTPNLKGVGRYAFQSAPNPASTVTFETPMTSLETIGDYAFDYFKGEIAFNAPFPKLKEVGGLAFSGASNPASTVVLNNAPLLETIGNDAFREFAGNVQLVGEFSRLRSIGSKAFYKASKESRVDIICRSDEGLTVGTSAFDDFGGIHSSGQGCTTTTATTTTTTATSTTTTTTTTTATSTTTTTTTATTTTTTTKSPSCYPRLVFAPPTTQPSQSSSPPPPAPTAWNAASADDLTSNWPTSSPVNEPVVFGGLPDDFFPNNVARQKYTADCLEEHPQLELNSTNPAALSTAALSYQLRWTKGGTANSCCDPTFVGQPPPKGLMLSGESGADDDTKALTIAASGKIMWLPQEVGNYTMWLIGGFFDGRDPTLQTLFGTDSTTEEDDQIVAAVWNFEITEKQAFKVTSFARATQDADGKPYSPVTGYSSIKLPTKEGDSGDSVQGVHLDCAVNSTYKVAPIDPSTVETNTRTEGSKLEYSLRNAPNGFFVDGSNGEILAVPTEPTQPQPDTSSPSASGIVIAELVATNPLSNGGGQAVVQNISIRVRYKDEANPANGPNGEGCKNGGSPIDNANTFDGKFECNCDNSDFEGAACTESGPDGNACKHGSAVVDAIPFDGKFTCDCTGIRNVYQTESGQCELATVCGEGQIESVAATATTDSVCIAASTSDGGNSSSGIGIALAIVFVLLLIVGIGYKRRQHEIKMQPVDFETLFNEMVASGDIETAEAAELRKHTPREIKRSFLTLIETIGAGQFGQVWKGLLDESPTGGAPAYLVAAKTVIASEASQDATHELQSEALVMAQVGSHINLVSLVGVVTRGDPLVVIISYCEHGSLLSLLRKRAKERSPLGIEAKLKIGLETACGMQHLVANHFIHRDLAARNVLIATGMVAKVADFGLSRGMSRNTGSSAGTEDANDDEVANADPDAPEYYRSQNGIFPVRWTAPEAMESLKFSTASDVWSFGIVMVEMYQNGAEPYSRMSLSEVTMHVMSGKQHEQPPGCVTAMYELLCDCWSTMPSDRPTFDRVIHVLKFNLEKVAGSGGVGSGTSYTASAAGYGRGTLGAALTSSEYEYAGTSLANAQLRGASTEQHATIGVVEETNLDDAAARTSARANGYGGPLVDNANGNTTAALAGYGKRAVPQSRSAQGGYGNAVPWQEMVANSRLVSHATSFDPLFSVLLQRPLDKEDAALQRAEDIFQMSYAPDAKTLYKRTPAEVAAAQASIDDAAAAVAEKNRIAELASELFQSGNPTNNVLPRSDVEALVNTMPRPAGWSAPYLARYIKQAWVRAKEDLLCLQIEQGMMHEAEFQRLYKYMAEYIHNVEVGAAAFVSANGLVTGGGRNSAPLSVLPAPLTGTKPKKKTAWFPGGGGKSKTKGNRKTNRRGSAAMLMDGNTLGEFEI